MKSKELFLEDRSTATCHWMRVSVARSTSSLLSCCCYCRLCSCPVCHARVLQDRANGILNKSSGRLEVSIAVGERFCRALIGTDPEECVHGGDAERAISKQLHQREPHVSWHQRSLPRPRAGHGARPRRLWICLPRHLQYRACGCQGGPYSHLHFTLTFPPTEGYTDR